MRSRSFQWSITVVVSIVAGLLIVPELVIIPASFGNDSYITFPPSSYSLRWYAELFSNPAWQRASGNSLLVAVLSAMLASVVGTFAALGVMRCPPRFRSALVSFYLLPMIVPTIVTALALYGLLAKLGLRGSTSGIVLGHTILALPFVVINVTAALQRMDVRLEHAARSLGAGAFAAFRRVTLPIIWPGIAVGAAFAFLGSFSELVLALFLTNGATATLPVQMWSGIRFEINPTVAAASTFFVLLSLLTLIVAGLLQLRASKLGVNQPDK